MPSGPAPGAPRVVRVLEGEALETRSSATGRVGRIFTGAGFEVVWVEKSGEAIDPAWFDPASFDLLVVVRGRLRVEFERPAGAGPVLLGPGDVLVLPRHGRCRAYRWPRSTRRATVFLAVYPTGRRRTVPRRSAPRGGRRGRTRGAR